MVLSSLFASNAILTTLAHFSDNEDETNLKGHRHSDSALWVVRDVIELETGLWRILSSRLRTLIHEAAPSTILSAVFHSLSLPLIQLTPM
ncbi:hypothetical protein PLICRDRAFT_40416 [Plicaturopsis crispa FD-325 SS-3]|nr:hypothetical protein PLICRDRAFT_40416 [Plicaturopsis crispa FD-325 SS-3]